MIIVLCYVAEVLSPWLVQLEISVEQTGMNLGKMMLEIILQVKAVLPPDLKLADSYGYTSQTFWRYLMNP